jgi:hypothetical protein
MEGGGNVTGSKSRSGIGGARRGLRVIRSRTKRRKALEVEKSHFVYPHNVVHRTHTLGFLEELYLSIYFGPILFCAAPTQELEQPIYTADPSPTTLACSVCAKTLV